MSLIKTETIPEQVAAHLREGIASGRWVETLPGRDMLASELGVSPRSVQKAVALLEKEKLIESQGQGKSRRIRLSGKRRITNPIRVAMLLFKMEDRTTDYVIELRHQLDEAGHIPIVPDEGQQEMGMNVKRVERLVRSTKADAWVVMSGSREILQWFVDQNIKVFALAGRHYGLPIAGVAPNKQPIFDDITRRLVQLGHSRIVLLFHEQLRLPYPGLMATTFLQALESSGVIVGEYNMPNWGKSQKDFLAVLDSLFKNTPPTAIIVDEPYMFHAVYHFLAQRKLRVPQDVSMFSPDGDKSFSWCHPTVAHIAWDYQPIVRRVMRWVNNVARGGDDLRKSFTKATYIEGGTVGPPPD